MPKSRTRPPPKPVMVSATFLADAEAHIDDLCGALGLNRTKDPYAYSRLSEAASASPMSDEDVGILAWKHNQWCASAKAEMYDAECPWTKRDTQLTREQEVFVSSWAEPIVLAPARWDACFTEMRLTQVYEALRGRLTGSLHIACKPLTVEQADEVINLLAYQLGLDRHDLRLETPWTWERTEKGRRVLRRQDTLAPSAMQHGTGHVYCERCGVPVDQEAECPRRKCPIKEDLES